MGCWFNNADTVEGNTFAGNRQAALLVMGPSGPKVRRNIFINSPIAVCAAAWAGCTARQL